MKKYKTGMLIFPDLTLLDFAGPYDTFIKAGCFEIFVISETKDIIKAEGGLSMRANYTFEECPPLDILFVPGGKGINSILENENYLLFLRQQAVHTQYITSVCTGALVLAAAGLLNGFRATTHWRSLEILKMFGVEVVKQRFVVDRNRITGAGVTAGIDFGLILTSIIAGKDLAKRVQLILEYNPEPPFNSGSSEDTEPHILESAKHATQSVFEERVKVVNRILTKGFDQ